MTKQIPQSLAYFILATLSILSTVGHFFKSSILINVGLASLASPLLIVYSELEGEKVMTFKYELKLETTEGEKIIDIDKNKYNQIASHENKFNRHIMILPYVAATYLLTETRLDSMRQQILSYGLCNFGPYSKLLDLEAQILKGEANIYKDPEKKTLFNHFSFTCS